MEDIQKITGIVKVRCPEKFFGVISANGKDYFFHGKTCMKNGNGSIPAEETRVSFIPAKASKVDGMERAVNVEVL